jgi:peptidoglycan/xylan/chitin deacetylase (PgdA/CDA1 family)
MMDYASRLRDDRFVIFLFHGVIDRQIDPVRNYTRKHLEAAYFVDRLRSLLDAGGHPVSLNEVLDSHQAGEDLPPKSFAITFDDGFLNNLTVAAPVLADLAIPATFYITSDFIDSNRMSWVDRIEWAVAASAPAGLRFPWGGGATFSSAEDKRLVMTEIRRRAKTEPGLDLDALASDLQHQLGFPETWAADGPLDSKMTWRQVAQLYADPLFEVGGHSHSHGILALMDEAALDRELDLSLSLLREHAGIGPRHYSYPEGLAHCFSDQVIAKLKERGVVICPTAIDGDNDHGTDLFHLRRIMAV